MPGGSRGKRTRNNSPASNTRSRSRTSDPVIIDDPERSASENESGEDSEHNEEIANVFNESPGTEVPARNDEAKANQEGEYGNGKDIGQNANAAADPDEEIHRNLEEMLDDRIIATENEGRIVNKRMRCVREDLSTYNLTRLKTAISLLQTAQNRVEETAKEIAEHNEKKKSSEIAYAGRCHKKKTQLVLKTDKKIDKAQRLLDEKSVEEKENSPEDMRKMCSNLKPTTKLSDEMTLEEQDAWFKEFLSYYSWNESVLRTQPYDTRIQVLYNCISPSLVMLLSTDSTMSTDDGKLRGIPIVKETPKGNCLTKLRGYLLAENPIAQHGGKNATRAED